MSSPSDPSAAKLPAEQPGTTRRWPLYVVLGALVAVVVGFAVFSDHGSSSADYGATARSMCEDFVKVRLGSRRYAQQFIDTKTTAASGRRYLVEGDVDSFGPGGVMRDHYRCEVRDNGDGTWDRLDVSLAR